jgi:hypothetical protein
VSTVTSLCDVAGSDPWRGENLVRLISLACSYKSVHTLRRKLQLIIEMVAPPRILLDMVLRVCKISPAFSSQLSTVFYKLGG